MKLKFFPLLILLFAAHSASAQVLRPMAPRYSNPSVRGNIIYVANNSITSSGEITTEAPPGGTATNNGNIAANIDIDGVPPTTYVAFGANWKYLANNTRPANWQTTGFADGAWPNGNGQFGYGDGDEATCVPSGGGGTVCLPTGNKYITTYFRKQVTIANPSLHSGFTLNVRRDDGIAVYVNGVEIYRNNLPGGALAHGTLATNATDNGNTIQSVTLPSSTFAVGNNTIAVEVHQTNATSSDLSFDMELLGNPITTVTMIPNGANWKYLANNTRPAGWETVAYDDVLPLPWPNGNAEFGYGDGGEVTCVPSGGGGTLCTPTGNKYITTYFRKVVNIANPASYPNFIINLIRDDGGVVYVNGVEVVRSNMPAGAIGHGTFSASVVSGADESAPYSYTIPSSYFVNGNNTIAVEIHQSDLTSSDISFNMELLATTDSTFNSSSANLSLTSCAKVLFAGLYWGATQGTDGTNTAWITGETNIDIMLPGGSVYQTITSLQTDYHNNTLVPGLPHTGYRCFADITSLINVTNPNGVYTVANLAGPAGIINGAGGWTIVIAYADPATIVRNLTVFDGSVIMNGGDPALHIPITGFLTPPSGAVSCELGAVVFDGDRVSVDEFSFKQNSNPLAGTYTNMTPNATANLNDMWNSTISYKGAVVATRNPAHQNTLGYDADIIDVPNAGNVVLGNSQSSASIRFSSPSENYMLQVATTAISQYTPSFALEKGSTDVNGGGLVGGDIIRYRVNYTNVGNDASTNTIITDNIPAATSFVPGSININGVAKTDAPGDDQAEYDYVNRRVMLRIGTGSNAANGGSIASLAPAGYIEFDVYAASSCTVLSCGTPTDNTARIDYNGQTSGISLYDSSGYNLAGCLTQGPISNVITGSCYVPVDTTLINICPSTSIMLPVAAYAGYTFYSAMPFIPANIYNESVPVPVSVPRVFYAWFNSGPGCIDTIRINILHQNCPDLDEDDDGLPDYLELNDPLALQDHDIDGIPNWNDVDYPGWVDNNTDGLNDNFDPGADADNDGQVNFMEAGWPGFVDSNGDGMNDTMDKDLDGIPNFLDRDSDNDGIPDVVESNGVDANGDGRIDNFTDPDSDGLSQNIDASSGVTGSGNGLGAIDTDADGIPNYIDTDSDNDGIPDVVEVYGTDANNDGRIDAYTDNDLDGYADNVDGDAGNDGTAENVTNTLLRTGTDTDADGRADSYPYKNMDADSKTNPYDLDSDGDGINDVKEAGFTDDPSAQDGRVDGAVNSNGWNTGIAAMPSLVLPNTDATGRVNVYDIDTDDDGIPDNVEGQPTAGYLLPSGADTDLDGIDNSYDNFNGFGGDGIHFYDRDGDTVPDYIDTDTDNDGVSDIIEGNDLNFNGLQDDNITLAGADTDDDGLDDTFDSDNTSTAGTSQYMGNGGTTSGDPSPGSITTVQHTASGAGCGTERDWRCLGYVLSCEIITFKGLLQNQSVKLDWTALCKQEVNYFIVQRSTDRASFNDVGVIAGRPILNEIDFYHGTDDISNVSSDIIYYRLKTIMQNGKTIVSNIISVRRAAKKGITVQIFPNPVRDQLQVSVNTPASVIASILIVDGNGKTIKKFTEKLLPGSNTFLYKEANHLPNGVYYLRLNLHNQIITQKFNILK